MTIGEYVQGLLGQYGIRVTEAELLLMLADTRLAVDGSDTMSTGLVDVLNLAMVRLIPYLMTLPAARSVAENGHSVSVTYDKEGLLALYDYLCRRYNLDNQLDGDRPTVTFV